MKECNLNKNKNLPKIEVVCQNAKRSFFGMFFFAFWWFCFLLPVFWFLCFAKKAQKGYFPAILEVFLSTLFPQKACLKVFLFFPFSVFLLLSSLSKLHFIPLLFWPSAPFWKTLIFLVSFFFFFLLFPFLMFACFFQTNFPNIPFIPFLKSNLLSFLAVSFFLLFLFLFWLCMFQPFFCCYAGFVFGVFFGFVLCFVFVFFLVLVPVYEKKLFSLQF